MTATANIDVAKAIPTIVWPNPLDIDYGMTLGEGSSTPPRRLPAPSPNAPRRHRPVVRKQPDAVGDVLAHRLGRLQPDDRDGQHQCTDGNSRGELARPDRHHLRHGADASELDASATIPGSFAYTPDTGAVLHAGDNQVLTAVFTPTDPSYGPITTRVTINVAQATPTVTWANPAAITYGTTLNTSQLNATASVPGAFSYMPGLLTVLPAGSGEPLAAVFYPTDATDYTIATATAQINVAKATPTVAWRSPPISPTAPPSVPRSSMRQRRWPARSPIRPLPASCSTPATNCCR